MTQPYRDPAPKPAEAPRMCNAERDSIEKELDSLYKELELLRSTYAQGRCGEISYAHLRNTLSDRLDKLRTRLSVLDVAGAP